ncbi:24183_t:CDS:2, partial [Gigaspora rosea]
MSRQPRYSSSLIEDYENDNTETAFENDNAETVYEIFEVTNTGNVKEKYKPIKKMSREESELLWKIDIRVIPLFALLYTFSFMDKVNIGNAKLENLEEDLHLTENQYNMILASFFIAYVLFEVPSNIMLMNSRPSVWIPSIMLACGIILICTAAAQNFPQIMILRFLLGTFEAGFFPGAVFYITKWYKNNEENFRISLFVSAATIAGAFSGLMSFSISTFFHEANGLGETASWLTRRERKLAIERLSHEPSHHHKDYTEKHQILEAFKDWKIYMAMLLYFCILAPLYSFSFFISSIVKGLGFDALVAIASDRAGVRGPYLICCLLVAIMGYAFLITQNVSIP